MGSAFDKALARLADRLLPSPGRAHLAGGALRDLILERPPRDIDLLVEGDAQAERSTLHALSMLSGMEPVIFDRRPPATHRVVLDGIIVDTSFCPPDGVAAALRRRDFTVNALAAPLDRLRVHLQTGEAAAAPGGEVPGLDRRVARFRPLVIDPVGGLEDMLRRLVRSATAESLRDDPLRLLRAVRLAATLPGFEIEAGLRGEIRSLAPRVTAAAWERIGSEMTLILRAPVAGAAVREMDGLGLLDPILPELDPLRGLEQPRRYHDHDAREHTLRALEEADSLAGGDPALGIGALDEEGSEILKWAALLHDTGKAASATRDAEGRPHFYGHEERSACLAEKALRRLRIPARVETPVLSLVRWHVRLSSLASARAGDRSVRRLVRLAGDLLVPLILLALADRRAGGGENPSELEAALVKVCRHALDLREEIAQVAAAPPLLDGREVMDLLGLAPGPRVGSVLRWIDRLRTEGRIRTRDEAIAILKDLPPSRTGE